MAHPNRLNSAALDLIPNTATADELKAAMRQLAAGISVLTTGTGDARTGATVTSATALSVEPPTIIVNINLTMSVRFNLLSLYHARSLCQQVVGDIIQPGQDFVATK